MFLVFNINICLYCNIQVGQANQCSVDKTSQFGNMADIVVWNMTSLRHLRENQCHIETEDIDINFKALLGRTFLKLI